MVDNNGKYFRIIIYLVGVIVTLVLFKGMPSMATTITTNDKESRCRDENLKEKIYRVQKENSKMFNQIMMGQAEMQTVQAVMQRDIKYLKEAG